MAVLDRFDHRLIGLAAGIMGPGFGFLIFYLIMFSHVSLSDFIKMIASNGSTQAPLIAICLIFNLVFFFGALRMNWYRTAQGVIMAMFIYAPVIIYLKYA